MFAFKSIVNTSAQIVAPSSYPLKSAVWSNTLKYSVTVVSQDSCTPAALSYFST